MIECGRRPPVASSRGLAAIRREPPVGSGDATTSAESRSGYVCRPFRFGRSSGIWLGRVFGRLERADLTAPIVFVGVGVLIANVASFNPHFEAETVKLVTEVTLAWVLFSDAARVGVRELRNEATVYIRLLAIALPLTVALGWLLAWGLFGALDPWLALLVGAALAPTDAALGAAVINNPAVPARVRGILNVESGLNDGIATPIVLVALAAPPRQRGTGAAPSMRSCS